MVIDDASLYGVDVDVGVLGLDVILWWCAMSSIGETGIDADETDLR